jgi:AP-1-like factor
VSPTDALDSQRAFRERKERHVRDLEAKLSALENSTHSLQSDNERLKLALQRARTENEILRATTGQHSPPSSRPVSASYPTPGALLPDDEDVADETYNVQPLPDGSVINIAEEEHAASQQKGKSKDMSATQTWDFLQSHPLVKQGLVDIADVCERLKSAAKCDGRGPVFAESAVFKAIEEARRGGGDELI